MIAVDGVELDIPLGALEAEPELTVVVLEGGPEEALGTALLDGTAFVAVLLGDNRTLVLVGVVPLEADIVVAFTDEDSTVTVVVILAKAVPESVRSIYSIAVIVLV